MRRRDIRINFDVVKSNYPFSFLFSLQTADDGRGRTGYRLVGRRGRGGPVSPSRSIVQTADTLITPEREREIEGERRPLSLLAEKSDGITRNLTRAANRYIITAQKELGSERSPVTKMTIACAKRGREA